MLVVGSPLGTKVRRTCGPPWEGSWVFDKGDRPSLIISKLEALAGRAPLKLCCANRGNGAALNKLVTSKIRASAVLMEMAAYMTRIGMKVLAEWSPREGDKEADALADVDTELRIPASAAGLVRDVLPAELQAGRTVEHEYQPANGEPVVNLTNKHSRLSI